MKRIEPSVLEAYARRLLVAIGATDENAAAVAESLVASDLRGHASHGVLRIPFYERMIGDDVLDPTATPVVESRRGSTASVDGNFAFGQVVGRTAVDLATEIAAETGVAIVGIRNATHLGRVGEWGERVADEGFLFSAKVNTQGGALSVAPAGSVTPRFSTNPIVYGVPTFDALAFPVVFDAATSQVARGKLSEHRAAETSLPAEWVVSPDGEPITDPGSIDVLGDSGEGGAIRPLGGTTSGYKGSGLSVVAELFAGVLGQAPVVGQGTGNWFSNAASFVAIDPLAFSSREAVASKVESVARQVRETPNHPNVPVGAGASGDELLLPGEAEHAAAEDRARSGIPVSHGAARELRELAANCGVKDETPDALR